VATVRITTRLSAVQSVLKAFPPRVSIDGGEEQSIPWRKTTDLSVPAGTHQLQIYFPYMLPSKMGLADIELSLEDGDTVELSYKPPWIRTRPGRLRVVS
jgi:hypothetical protein